MPSPLILWGEGCATIGSWAAQYGFDYLHHGGADSVYTSKVGGRVGDYGLESESARVYFKGPDVGVDRRV